MNGVNPVTIPAEDNSSIVNTFENSPFNILPVESILRIFLDIPKPDLLNLRGVCRDFRVLAGDQSLLRDEIKGVQDAIRNLLSRRENKESVQLEVNAAEKNQVGGAPKLFKLLGIIKRLFSEIPKRELAQFVPAGKVLEKAPFCVHYIQNQYRECWSRFLCHELETKNNTVSISENFTPETFSIFLGELNNISGDYKLELDFSVNREQALMTAEAIRKGSLKAKEICIFGSPHVNREILSIYFDGIGGSSHVNKLRIAGCALYADEFTNLYNSLATNTTIRSLSISDFAFGPLSLQIFSDMLAEHPEITELELTQSSGVEMVALLQNINQTNMKKLAFHRSMMTFDTISHLAEILPTLEQVRVLDLQHNQLSNEEIDFLHGAMKDSGSDLDLKLPDKKIDLTMLRIMRLL